MPCTRIKLDGVTTILCGAKAIPVCVKCRGIATLLCDYPVVKGVTCDVPICERCALEIGPDLHLCPGHAERDRGAPQQSLPL